MTGPDVAVPEALGSAGHLRPPSKGASVTITIVIPNYNHADIIARAIVSVVEQVDADTAEIVVVDDGSTDDSRTVLMRLAEGYPLVRVVFQAVNRGAPSALNAGLREARGEFISFLGADDVALPELYRSMIEALRQNPIPELACGEIVTFDVYGRVLAVRPTVPPSTQPRCFTAREVRAMARRSDNWICNTATVYRTAAVRRIGGFDPSLGAFCDGFLVRQLAFASGFCFVPGIAGGWQVAAQTLSARSMLDGDEHRRLTSLLTTRIRESSIERHSPGYSELYRRRWCFAAARMQLIWLRRSADPRRIVEAAGGTSLDMKALSILRAALGFGRAGRVASLAWLAFRLRPFSLPVLATHLIRNKVFRGATRSAAEDDIVRLTELGRRLTSRL